ncbi:META domain-containing protein, partial [Burkholderia pseudomallei]|nr:META domain-containing protein [Burkholderia pseudomallei]
MFNSSAAARMRLRIARSLRAPLGALTVAALLAACTMPTHPDSGAPAPDPFTPATIPLIAVTSCELVAWGNARASSRA